MTTVNNDDFNWDKLLEHFECKTKIIPVIGPGLYRVEVDRQGKTEGLLLYDYLAEQLLAECQTTLKPAEKNTFASE